MLMESKITAKIAELDPKQDYQEMIYLLACYEFPWDYQKALQFALFRTYGVPSISRLLCQTGEFLARPRKRYDDTELILSEIVENGFDSDRGQAALQRMNQMHGRFSISNDDFLYVLTTFIYEPIRWIERYGWRKLTEAEKQGIFNFYCELGRRMTIKEIPNNMEVFERFNLAYEREHFQYSDANYKVGAATIDLLLGFYLPKIFWPLGKPLVYAILDERLIHAFGFPEQPSILKLMVRNALRLRGQLLRWFPKRQQPYLGTQVQRPTYPEGYRIEELGTFGQINSK